MRAVMKALDAATRKYGLIQVKHAATKWGNAQRDRARIIKRRKELERELAEVSKQLR
jgi:hypothetical protein